MAQAAQRYGIVVRDKSGVVTFYGEDPTRFAANPYGVAPYKGAAAGFYTDWANHLVEKFPWSHLQALQTRMATRPLD